MKTTCRSVGALVLCAVLGVIGFWALRQRSSPADAWREAYKRPAVPSPEAVPAGTRPVAEGSRLEVERPMAGRLVVERSWELETWDPVWTEAPLEEVVRWLDDREGPAGAGARFYRCGLRAWD